MGFILSKKVWVAQAAAIVGPTRISQAINVFLEKPNTINRS